ncbi:MAG: SDR family oxidoreductase [Gammaproteobacteria bacterium]
MGKLSGKSAVITGGTTGIGFATAKLFLEEGARVLVTGRNKDNLEAAKKSLPDLIAVQSDAGDLNAVREFPERVKAELGAVDAVFLNAGAAKFAMAEEVTEALYDSVFDINVKCLFFTAQGLLPLMSADSSLIINSSAITHMGAPTASIYAASKAANHSMAKSLAHEWIGRGVRVNVISPGPIKTPIYGKFGLTEEQVDGFVEGAIAQTPIGRFGRPDEIAQTALFLATNASSFIVGEEIVVDGGWAGL